MKLQAAYGIVRTGLVGMLSLAVACAAAAPALARPLTPDAGVEARPPISWPQPASSGSRPSSVPVSPAASWVFSGADEDGFGTSVCISGEQAVVGAPRAFTDAESGRGVVRIYEREHWTAWPYYARAIPNPEATDGFGWSVALGTDTIAVGSPSADGAATGSGAVYAFVDEGYPSSTFPMQKIVGSGGAAEDAFGWFVAIDGDTMVVGAPGDRTFGTDAGAAYVFVRSGGAWTQQAKLLAADAAAGDQFGWEVDIAGDTIVVGASRRDGVALDTGAAYVFIRNAGVWTQQAKLTASDAQERDFFGNAVSIKGDLAVIGANADDDRASNAGAAYVFTRTESRWSETAKLTPEDGAADDYFGATVSTDGTVVAVGSPFNDQLGTDAGAVYLFADTGGAWHQQNKTTAVNGIEYDEFGTSVSLIEGTLLVGAPYAVNWDERTYPGAAYVVGVGWPLTDVYRFYNARAGTHFFTASVAEMRSVAANLSHIYTYEGVAYSFVASRNTAPLHRFYNTRTGTHFYTASEEERARVVSTLSHIFVYEGVAYNVADYPVAPAVLVHRFYNVRTGTHFYTASEEEKTRVQATLGNVYQYDGPAFYLQL